MKNTDHPITAVENKSRVGRSGTHLEYDLLLVGQPNVGKSVLFSRLTGVRAIVSNYPGTTVMYTEGRMRSGEETYRLVDAPGTYSLEPLDEAAAATVDLLDDARRLINVVDATHLERHLTLTLELLALNKPMAVALNMSDEARHKGIRIDASALETELGVPVVAIVARTGEGVKQLVDRCLGLPLGAGKGGDESGHPGHHPHLSHPSLGGAQPDSPGHMHLDPDWVWQRIGRICGSVQTLEHHDRSFTDRLESLSIHPFWGALFAVVVLAAAFVVVRMLGEFLITGGIGVVGSPWITLPFGTEILFERAVKPLLTLLSGALYPGSFLHRALIGTLVEGQIDFMKSFGILSSGLFIPFGVVFPYLIILYKEVINMPRGNRAGPMGLGPRSGRGIGYCAGFNAPGYAYPAFGGFGRGAGWRHGFYAAPPSGWEYAPYTATTRPPRAAHSRPS